MCVSAKLISNNENPELHPKMRAIISNNNSSRLVHNAATKWLVFEDTTFEDKIYFENFQHAMSIYW